jgi:hypothetical protein
MIMKIMIFIILHVSEDFTMIIMAITTMIPGTVICIIILMTHFTGEQVFISAHPGGDLVLTITTIHHSIATGITGIIIHLIHTVTDTIVLTTQDHIGQDIIMVTTMATGETHITTIMAGTAITDTGHHAPPCHLTAQQVMKVFLPENRMVQTNRVTDQPEHSQLPHEKQVIQKMAGPVEVQPAQTAEARM